VDSYENKLKFRTIRNLEKPYEYAFSMYKRWINGEEVTQLAAEYGLEEEYIKDLLSRMRYLVEKRGAER